MPFNFDESEKDKSADHVHKPIVSFSNRLENNNKQTAHMEKILDESTPRGG